MEFWPCDQRSVKTKPQKSWSPATDGEGDALENKDASLQGEVSARGPILTYGGLTAALLRERDSEHRRFEWDFISSEGQRLHRIGSPVQLFVGKDDDTGEYSDLSSHRKAEEALRFLHQRYADVDIPFEIIKEAIQEDIMDRNKTEDCLYRGNCLALVHSPIAKGKDNFTAVIFPAGGLGNRLNVSLLYLSRTKRIMFEPGVSPVATFETPIEQIVSSTIPYIGEDYSEDNPIFAIRTMSLITVYSVTFGRTLLSTGISQLALLKTLDMGGIMDMAISPFDHQKIALINLVGTVSILQVKVSGSECEILHNIPEGENSPLWRVCWSSDDNMVARSHAKGLDLVDISDSTVTPGLTFLGDEICLSIEGTISRQNSELHRITVTTTQRVIWIDDRYFNQVLLSWAHMREYDRSLRTQTCYSGIEPLTFLMSWKNSLVTVYNISTSGDTARSGNSPQILESQARHHARMGYAFYQNPRFDAHGINFLEFSPQIGLYSSQFKIGGESVDWPGNQAPVGSIALARAVQVNESPGDTKIDLATDYSIRESVEVNLESVYREIIASIVEKEGKNTKSEEIHNLLEQMSRFWQENDVPVEKILTMHDIALSVGAQLEEHHRSNFLAHNPLKSHNGYLLSRYGYFPKSEVLAAGAAWSFDLSTTISNLQDHIDTQHTSPEGKNVFHNEARYRQEMDHKLHNYVYSSQRVEISNFPGKRRRGMSLESATESLTLEDPQILPPSIQMAFLRPRPPAEEVITPKKNKFTDPIGQLSEASLGTRLLLSDWEIGSDPRQYVYTNPYPDAIEGNFDVIPPPHRDTQYGGDPPPPSRAPPKIGMSRLPIPPILYQVVRPNKTSPDIHQAIEGGFSQPHFSVAPEKGQSQDIPLPSTQILPGKHGGRPKPIAKKQKKRVGGF
ncbi:hypothetical protein FRC20_011090 [Serendipita sp. 405]|nr:hypothetical protein FRC20_011090 [Serendipita sp. 405]